MQVQYETLDLNHGVESDTFRLTYIQPLGEKQDYSLRYRVPVASVDALGNDDYGLGDASLQVGHVFGLTREGGFVAQGEMVFDTASRDELGTGKNVARGTFIAARFLDNGAILAPSLVQSVSLWGDGGRADVNTTTMDVYYVPKLADPRQLLTFDPALNADWETEKEYLSLAVTYGYVLGKAFGGRSILTIKPSMFFGGERPGDWGVEFGLKIIDF
ncbi:MAG: hypothetical protein NTV21_05275 [Planctomycetota bacterium]|nr:hypothetical protein [Planctomycetota bacterium]